MPRATPDRDAEQLSDDTGTPAAVHTPQVTRAALGASGVLPAARRGTQPAPSSPPDDPLRLPDLLSAPCGVHQAPPDDPYDPLRIVTIWDRSR